MDSKKTGERGGKSRRATQRLPLQGMISYRVAGHEYGNLAVDISEEGIFIKTLIPHPVGTRLDLTFQVPAEQGGFSLALAGEVVRVVDSEDPRDNGMGIRFTAVSATQPAAVRYLVSKIFNFDKIRESGDYPAASA